MGRTKIYVSFAKCMTLSKGSFPKETYILKGPTTCCHPSKMCV